MDEPEKGQETPDDQERVSRHEARRQRREQRKQERQEPDKAAERRKKLLLYGLFGVVAILAIYATGFLIVPFFTPADAIQRQLADVPNSFVHWHADVDIVVCGEERTLPEATPGNDIGSPEMHTHDKQENLRSLPGTDGNGLIHSEGNFNTNPIEHTMGRFMDYMNIPFTNTSVYEFSNGDACPDGKQGMLRMLLNGQNSTLFRDHVPHDGDLIQLEFGP